MLNEIVVVDRKRTKEGKRRRFDLVLVLHSRWGDGVRLTSMVRIICGELGPAHPRIEKRNECLRDGCQTVQTSNESIFQAKVNAHVGNFLHRVGI